MDSTSERTGTNSTPRNRGRRITLLAALLLLLSPFCIVEAAKGGERMAPTSVSQADNTTPLAGPSTTAAQQSPRTLTQDRLETRRFETMLRDPLLRERVAAPVTRDRVGEHTTRQLAAWPGLDTRQGKALSLAATLSEFETGRKNELRMPVVPATTKAATSPARPETAAVTQSRAEPNPAPVSVGKESAPAHVPPAAQNAPEPGRQVAMATPHQASPSQPSRNRSEVNPEAERQAEVRLPVSRHVPAPAPANQALGRLSRPTSAPLEHPEEAEPLADAPESEMTRQPATAIASVANATVSKANAAATPVDTARLGDRTTVPHPQPGMIPPGSQQANAGTPSFPVMPLFPPTPVAESATVLGTEGGSDGFVLASGAGGADTLRLPVNRATRRSVAIDMLAETQARKLLTEEAKKVLLPVTGELSAVFESGKEGIACIGYDRMGGTSYGKYQISSRTGTMKLFLDFLDERAPEWSSRLRKAGPSNTNSRWGGMASEWKKIAAESPTRFESLQDEFILHTNYSPALNAIASRTNIDVESLSPALKEVLWSTAVQHGPGGASNIFANAVTRAGKPSSQNFDKELIEEIYRIRKTGFKSSSPRVRNAVKGRLVREQDMALSLLEKEV